MFLEELESRAVLPRRSSAFLSFLQKLISISLVTALLGGIALLATGCTPLGPAAPGVTVFYVVNQTEQQARVKVLSDGTELFIVEIESAPPQSDAGRTLPPSEGYPAKEIRVPLDSYPKNVDVEEMVSGREQQFNMAGIGNPGLGYRITISFQGITLTQDYVPIR